MYLGGKLAPWFDTGPNKAFCRAAAGAGGRRMTTLVKMNTPVDTGELRQSIKQTPVKVTVDALGHQAYESGAETDVDYAPHVEYGTGLWGPKHSKYPIVPKKPGGTLHWVNDAGEHVFAKKVMHPGSPGNHMFAIGVAITEAGIDSIVAPWLHAWARIVEKQNKSGLGGL